MAYLPADEQHNPFQLVRGASEGWTAGWRGMVKNGSPAGLAPNQLRHAFNVIFGNGIVYGRVGSTQVADLAGVPYYAGNFQIQCPRKRLWLAVRGCQGVGAATGVSILTYDSEVTPTLQIVARFPGPLDSSPHFGNLSDKLFVGYNSLLRELQIIDNPRGLESQTFGSSQAHLPLKNFSGYRVVGMLEFPEIATLFIALQDTTTPANGKIVSYNGLSFSDEYTGFCPLAFGRWRNQILAGFDGSIRWRDNNSSTWTNVALGGFTCYSSVNAMAEYQTKTYIAGGNDLLYSYDGTTLALERTIAGCSTGGDGLTAVTNHRGILYYLWNTTTTLGMKLGKYDVENSAVGFQDTYKDLVGQVATWNNGSGLLSFRSTLFASRGHENLIGSPMNDVLGTWINVGGSATTGGNFKIVSLFAY